MKLSGQQQQALDAIGRWMRSDQQVFRLFGYAGTGKTTLARYAATGATLYCSYTGKAAYVLRQKGCEAFTIHQLIYCPKDRSQQKLKALEAKLKNTDDSVKIAELERQIAFEHKKLNSPNFVLNPDSAVKTANLVVVDECFVKNTLVDTPTGPKEISTLNVGDKVINAAGVDTIIHTSKRLENEVVKISVGKKTIYCSKNHPFFTHKGIKIAIELRPGDGLLETRQAMRLLRKAISIMPRSRSFLLSILFGSLVNGEHRQKSEVWGRQSEMVGLERSKSEERDEQDKKSKPHGQSKSTAKNKSTIERDWSQAKNPRRKWSWLSGATGKIIKVFRRFLDCRVCSSNRTKAQVADALQTRPCRTYKENSNRSRWQFPLCNCTATARQEERCFFKKSRVDSVEVLESSNPELDRFRDAEGQLYLYDLSVEQHQSFSVGGFLVHNCSMVNEQMAKDLMSFGTKILVLGDPAQLPPVFGTGYFIRTRPDFMLTEIHRQARDNPIIQLATRVRTGKILRPDSDMVVPWGSVTPDEVLGYDQILVGRNATRKATNRKIRALLGRQSDAPEEGDRLVCLRNDHEVGLLNGAIWETESCFDGDEFLDLIIFDPDSSSNFLAVEAHRHHFLSDAPTQIPFWIRKEAQEFDYGYALTCHKSQGSQWDRVLIFDESGAFGRDAHKWLYTAVTRAAKEVKVVTR